MAKNSKYKVPKRRRREGKTNYYKRYEILKNNQIRAVIRKTNKYVIVQFVYATPVGDYTLAAAHSRELVKLFEWKGGAKSTPAAYLTGLLAGLRARKLGITYAIPDIGLNRPVRGSKIFAALKGIRNSGIEIPCSDEVLPSDERIRGVTIAEYAKMLNETNQEKYLHQFGDMIKKGLDPRLLPEHFDDVYRKIVSIYNTMPESHEARQLIETLVIKTRGV
jgi:large subunit ribosomal protein L18